MSAAPQPKGWGLGEDIQGHRLVAYAAGCSEVSLGFSPGSKENKTDVSQVEQYP